MAAGAVNWERNSELNVASFCFLFLVCEESIITRCDDSSFSSESMCLGVGKASGFVTVHTRAANAYNRSSTLDVSLKQRRRQFEPST